ncbi:DMT family transporter [Rubrobacter indicoceani]|uniref:DMT family transporter n=1 Tax=Rubrobacter indicoceani TaxID=2051957 RepID=UPI000E5AFCD3|nr:EamA family transporter [Rubrobacter indicoceani]
MRRDVLLAFGVLIALWGSSFAVVKVGLEVSPPLLFAGLRAMVGGAVMLLVARMFGGKPNFRRNAGAFVALTLLNVVFFIGFQTFAIMSLPSGLAAVLVYLQPVLVGLLAWRFLGEGLSGVKVSGLLLGFFGIAVVSLGGLASGVGGTTASGVLFGVLSAFFWACGTVYFKRVQDRVSPLWSVAVPFFAGGVMLSLLGLLTESVSDVELGAVYLGSLAYSSLAGISASWLIWFALVGAGEASRVSAYIFAVPLSAVVVGVVVLGEELHASLVFGGALVLLGIYLVNRSPVTRPPVDRSRVNRSALSDKLSADRERDRKSEEPW